MHLCVGISFHKLVRSTPTQKPYKHYNEGEGLCPFEPCHEGGHPLMHLPCVRFIAGGALKKCGFFPQKSALRIWWFSHTWTFSWKNCPFSSMWNRLWRLKVSFTIKGLTAHQCCTPWSGPRGSVLVHVLSSAPDAPPIPGGAQKGGALVCPKNHVVL